MASALDKEEDLAYIKVEGGQYVLYYHKILLMDGREVLGAVPARLVNANYKVAKQLLNNCLDTYKSKGWM